MTVYRIAKERYIRDLSGTGAELSGGRWNPKGFPALYTSSSLPLCMCEILAHTDRDISPTDMCFAEISCPDDCISEEFFSEAALESSSENGAKWLRAKSSLAIKVLSALLPKNYAKDFNIILNPLHKDFSLLRIESVLPVTFDVRFFQQ